MSSCISRTDVRWPYSYNSHRESSQALQPLAQSSRSDGPIFNHFPKALNANFTGYGLQVPGPQPVEQDVFPPMLPQAGFAMPQFDDYYSSQQLHRNHAPDINSGNDPRPRTPYLLQVPPSSPGILNAPVAAGFQGSYPHRSFDPPLQLQDINFPQPQSSYSFQVASSHPNIPIAPTSVSFPGNHPQLHLDPRVSLQNNNHSSYPSENLMPTVWNDPNIPIAPTAASSQGNHPQLQLDPRMPLQNSNYSQYTPSYPLPVTQSDPNIPIAGFYGNLPQLPAAHHAPLQNSMLNSSMEVPTPSKVQRFYSRDL